MSPIVSLKVLAAHLYSTLSLYLGVMSYSAHTLKSPGRSEQPAMKSSVSAQTHQCGLCNFHFLFSASAPHVHVKADSLIGNVSFFNRQECVCL